MPMRAGILKNAGKSYMIPIVREERKLLYSSNSWGFGPKHILSKEDI